MKAVVESQLQAQFLRGQGAGAQADTELIEHMSQKECEWLQQYQRVL